MDMLDIKKFVGGQDCVILGCKGVDKVYYYNCNFIYYFNFVF